MTQKYFGSWFLYLTVGKIPTVIPTVNVVILFVIHIMYHMYILYHWLCTKILYFQLSFFLLNPWWCHDDVMDSVLVPCKTYNICTYMTGINTPSLSPGIRTWVGESGVRVKIKKIKNKYASLCHLHLWYNWFCLEHS